MRKVTVLKLFYSLCALYMGSSLIFIYDKPEYFTGAIATFNGLLFFILTIYEIKKIKSLLIIESFLSIAAVGIYNQIMNKNILYGNFLFLFAALSFCYLYVYGKDEVDNIIDRGFRKFYDKITK